MNTVYFKNNLDGNGILVGNNAKRMRFKIKGLDKRVSSKSDRRINLICLTPEAGPLQDQTMEIANQTLHKSLEGVTSAQIDIAKEVLQKMYDNLI